MLYKRFYRSSESTTHYFPTHLLSDYFLLSAYFLGVSCYKCMHLTSTYSIPPKGDIIMAYGSMPSVGMAPKKNGSHIKSAWYSNCSSVANSTESTVHGFFRRLACYRRQLQTLAVVQLHRSLHCSVKPI